MRDGILTFEHGEVRLNGELIPGILRSLSVTGLVRFDDAKQDAMSGKVKTPIGWEDADVFLGLELTSDDSALGGDSLDCYQKLARINAIFKGYDNGANPKVYDVVNPHLRARGINQVVFSSLDSEEGDDDDAISARLIFVEHNPPVQIAENRANAKDKATGPPAVNAPAEPAKDAGIMKDPGPFAAGYEGWK